MADTALCKSCKEEKVKTLFYKDSRNKSGVHSYCKDCCKLTNKSWRDQNKDHLGQYKKDWYASNKSAQLARVKLRKNSLVHRTPSWLTQEQKEEIAYKYWLARDLKAISGEDYHVDHIIPLNGKIVSGFHTPDNLQILPAKLNLSKGNSYG
jgi:hypothetical protein